MTSKKIYAALLGVLVGSFVMAAVFMRVPALWPLMPTWLGEWFAALLSVQSQEMAGNVEFLAAWAMWLIVFGAVGVIGLTLARKQPPKQ
ncbi:hypothetical protein LP417_11250 [Polaromonas sp. P1-6]|nr:hypothetical protein LP417_11250 [Polaromonas sp. P1-6]